MIYLKPCPCCGHRAELAAERCDYGDWYTIECLDCGLMIEGSDRQKIIDAWQHRSNCMIPKAIGDGGK